MVLMDILCSAHNSLHDHLPLSTDTDKSLFVYLKIEKKKWSKWELNCLQLMQRLGF